MAQLQLVLGLEQQVLQQLVLVQELEQQVLQLVLQRLAQARLHRQQ
jgi:hypothetical protein